MSEINSLYQLQSKARDAHHPSSTGLKRRCFLSHIPDPQSQVLNVLTGSTSGLQFESLARSAASFARQLMLQRGPIAARDQSPTSCRASA
jgi:hypothetical protein